MPILEFLRISNWKDLRSITKFTRFIQLTNLKIEDCERIESFPDLQDLVSLKHMRIVKCKSMDGPPPFRRIGGGDGVSRVWPPNLDSLEVGKLRRPISEWGSLPTSSLVELTLWGGFGSSSTAEKEEDVKSFPTSLLIPSSSLTSLGFVDFKEMERISSKELQHLTGLQHLRIKGCPRLKDLPETLLPSLLSLRITVCHEELEEKMKTKKGSYWHLLSHIPQVNIF